MVSKKRLLLPCFFFCTISLLAQDLAKLSRAEDAGFSSERLGRIRQFFQGEVDKGAVPGAVLVVARNGKVVYRQAVGYQNREEKIAMKEDSIFRIFSMTKPIATVAVMMLAEEGKIDLLAPASQYLPEFKDLKVGVEKMDAATGKATLVLEPVQHPMTVQDLLRHTSGLVYGPFGNTRFIRLTTRPICSTRIRLWRSLLPSCRSCRWLINRERRGSTACQSTYWAESLKWLPECLSIASWRNASPNLWACRTLLST